MFNNLFIELVLANFFISHPVTHHDHIAIYNARSSNLFFKSLDSTFV